MSKDPITREDIEKVAGIPFDKIRVERKLEIARALEQQRGFTPQRAGRPEPMSGAILARRLGMTPADLGKLPPERRLYLYNAESAARDQEARQSGRNASKEQGGS